MALSEVLKDKIKGLPVEDARKITNYVSTLMPNFTSTQIEDMVKNPYFNAIASGGTGAGIAQAIGTNDPNAVNEVYKKIQEMGTQGINTFDALTKIASNPALYSKTLSTQQAATEGKNAADPLVASLASDLGTQQTQSQNYLDRVLAARGLSNSGAVGAGLTDIAGKYAQALKEGSTNIRNTANVAATNHTIGQYDTQVAQTQADAINKKYLDAIASGQQANQPTIWDYAGSAINALTGIGGAGKNFGLWGK